MPRASKRSFHRRSQRHRDREPDLLRAPRCASDVSLCAVTSTGGNSRRQLVIAELRHLTNFTGSLCSCCTERPTHRDKHAQRVRFSTHAPFVRHLYPDRWVENSCTHDEHHRHHRRLLAPGHVYDAGTPADLRIPQGHRTTDRKRTIRLCKPKAAEGLTRVTGASSYDWQFLTLSLSRGNAQTKKAGMRQCMLNQVKLAVSAHPP